METTLRDRICCECGRRFGGGPRAWYCPACRYERRKAQTRAYKARRLAGMTRPLGSVDHCTVCGGAYTVTGPNQRYCPTCAPDAVAAVDRQQALDWYRCNSDRINPERNARRRYTARRCAMCCKPFDATGTAIYCSDECRAAARRLAQARSDAHRSGKPEPLTPPAPRRVIDWSGVDWSRPLASIARDMGTTYKTAWAARKRQAEEDA